MNTPNILASNESSFELKYCLNAGNLSKYKSNSSWVIVFIINFLSCEKKKNDPLLPAPSPDLKTESLLNFGLSEAWKLYTYFTN